MKVRIDMIHALYRSLGSLRAWVTVLIGAASPGRRLPGALAGGSHRSFSGPRSLPGGAASSSLPYRKHALPVLALLAAAALGLWLLLPGGALHAQNGGTIMFPENGEGTVAVFTATDPEGKSVEWSVLPVVDAPIDVDNDGTPEFTADDAADAALFEISKSGELTFASPPDFETPVGGTANNSNTYELVVRASDGSVTGYQKVEVEVTNEDEDATTGIELTSLRPEVSRPITVAYVDGVGNPYVGPDGLVNGNTDSNAGTVDTGGIVDPDRDEGNTGTTIPFTDVDWQWSKSSSRNGTYTDIPGTAAQMDTYTPASADQGAFLRVTGTYEDGEGEGKTVEATSQYPVRALPSGNSAPAFPADFDTSTLGVNDPPTADVDDGATEGETVTSEVVANDANNDELTYSLEMDSSNATDADVFQINRMTGEVTVGLGKTVNPTNDATNAPTTETRADDDFVVVIKATDPSGESAMVTLTITVGETDEAPVFTTGKASYEYAEGGTDAVETFVASDPEGATVAYALSGADSGKLSIDPSTGALTFDASPDFESPESADGDNVYEVTVRATSTGSQANATPKVTSLDVAVEVTNEEEAGMVALSASQPRIGVAIQVTSLTDIDGGVTGVTYQWEKSAEGTPASAADCSAGNLTNLTFGEIEGATSAVYTPVSADDGNCLQVTASYTDNEGSDEASAVPASAVQKVRNLAPEFADEEPTEDGIQIKDRRVAENAAATTVVTLGSAAVSADDVVDAIDDKDAATDDGPIVYLLSGADAASFSIDGTGQITVKSGAKLDYETKDTYVVTVTARDAAGLSSSVDVTIKITDMNEAPAIMRGGLAISGDTTPEVAEGTTAVETYSLVGPNAASGTWALDGADKDDFTFTGGVLAFATSPDFEAAADADRDNVYEVTLSADDGTYMAERTVTITVTNVDEDGELTFSSEPPVVDVALTATLADPDGPTNVAWQWALEQANGTYVDIDMATSDTYTPVATDEGFHLRVTVTYDDGHGAGKSLEPMITANAVIAGDPLLVRYDVNPKNGEIDKAEVIQGIDDFLFGTGNQAIEKADVITLIDWFLFGVS